MPSNVLRKGEDQASHHAEEFRAVVLQRANEKGISLAQALLEIGSEGRFSAANRERQQNLRRIEDAANSSKGWGRDRFTRAVTAKKVELMSRDRDLTELAAFRKAAGIVASEDPALLRDYRKDVQTL